MSDKAWISHSTGFVQPSPDGQSKTVPAVAAHRGELWCLWASPTSELFYTKTKDHQVFQPRLSFPDRGVPTLASLNGILHAVIVRDSGSIVNYVYDDVGAQWMNVAILADENEDGTTETVAPALISFHNTLFLVFRQDTTLVWSFFNEQTEQWSQLTTVTQTPVQGNPAVFVLEGKLHVLALSNAQSREILGFVFSPVDNFWEACDDVSEGKAAYGVSATSYGDRAYLGFQENGPGNLSHAMYISEYHDGAWHPQSPILSETSADPPQIVVLYGRVHCIFNTNDSSRDLKWVSRPILDYSLSTWMGELSDDLLLSNITVPGTHDSCAESNIPFVRTQYLSIRQQLSLGLRFLDLRCRVHDDGLLYMYHGGIPINLPFYLSLTKVMTEVFTFLDSASPAATPTDTVLISINNDDVAQGKANPSVFYDAIKNHMELTPPLPDGSSRWIFKTTTSTLGEARGRAVLLRRFAAPAELIDPTTHIGIDLSGWLNNNPYFTLTTSPTPHPITLHLQDKWQYSDRVTLSSLITSKLSFVLAQFERAIAGKPQDWYLNFCSAVGDPVEKGEVAESKWIAVGARSGLGLGRFVRGMNVVVGEEWGWGGAGVGGVGVGGREGTRMRLGVVALDYPELPRDSDLVARLIGTNM